MSKNEISNQTLAVLVLAGIAISMLGLFVSISGPGQVVTGLAVGNLTNVNGTATLVVNASIYLNITDGNITLGDIEIGTSQDSQGLGTKGNNNAGGYTGANVSGDFFNVSNDGSVTINITGYGSGSPFTTTTGAANALPTSSFQFNGNSSGSGTANTTMGDVPASFATRVKLVTELNNLEGSNAALIGVRVSVPGDEDAGKKEANINLVAIQTQ